MQDYFNEPYLTSYKTFAVDYIKSLANTILGSSSQQLIRNLSNFFNYQFIKNILLSEKSVQKSLEYRFIDRNKLERVYQRAIHTAEKFQANSFLCRFQIKLVHVIRMKERCLSMMCLLI